MYELLASTEACSLARPRRQTRSANVKRAAIDAQLRLEAFLHDAYADAQLAEQIQAALHRTTSSDGFRSTT